MAVVAEDSKGILQAEAVEEVAAEGIFEEGGEAIMAAVGNTIEVAASVAFSKIMHRASRAIRMELIKITNFKEDITKTNQTLGAAEAVDIEAEVVTEAEDSVVMATIQIKFATIS